MKHKYSLFFFILLVSIITFYEVSAEERNQKFITMITYLNETEIDGAIEYSSFSITRNFDSGPITFIVDRFDGVNHKLVINEFGFYSIKGKTIRIKTTNYDLVGEIIDNKIIIEGKEYLKQEE